MGKELSRDHESQGKASGGLCSPQFSENIRNMGGDSLSLETFGGEHEAAWTNHAEEWGHSSKQ